MIGMWRGYYYYIQRADLIIRDLGQCPRQGTGYKYCTYGTSTILYQVLLASNHTYHTIQKVDKKITRTTRLVQREAFVSW